MVTIDGVPIEKIEAAEGKVTLDKLIDTFVYHRLEAERQEDEKEIKRVREAYIDAATWAVDTRQAIAQFAKHFLFFRGLDSVPQVKELFEGLLVTANINVREVAST